MHNEPLTFPWQIGGGLKMKTDTNICGSLVKNQTHAVAIRLQDDTKRIGTLCADAGGEGACVAYSIQERAVSENSNNGPQGKDMAVRRLTPRECERLQGFPDDYTRIPWRGKPAEQCPDGPRYKALGNSMAVPVMRWIGERIQAVEDIKPEPTP